MAQGHDPNFNKILFEHLENLAHQQQLPHNTPTSHTEHNTQALKAPPWLDPITLMKEDAAEATAQAQQADNFAVLAGMDIQLTCHAERMSEIHDIIDQQNDNITYITQQLLEDAAATRKCITDQNTSLERLQKQFKLLRQITTATNTPPKITDTQTQPETTPKYPDKDTVTQQKTAKPWIQAAYGTSAHTPAFEAIFGKCTNLPTETTPDTNSNTPHNMAHTHTPVRHKIIYNPVAILLTNVLSDPTKLTSWVRNYKSIGQAHGIQDEQLLTALPTRLQGQPLEAYHTLNITANSTLDSVIHDLKKRLNPTPAVGEPSAFEKWKNICIHPTETPNEFYIRVLAKAQKIPNYQQLSFSQQSALLLKTIVRGFATQYKTTFPSTTDSTGHYPYRQILYTANPSTAIEARDIAQRAYTTLNSPTPMIEPIEPIHTSQGARDRSRSQTNRHPKEQSQTSKTQTTAQPRHSSTQNQAQTHNGHSTANMDDVHALLISEKLTHTVKKARIFSQMQLQTGYYASALVDTGATVSIIAECLAREENFHITTENMIELQGVTGHRLEIIGVVYIDATWGHLTRKIKLHVQTNATHQLIIGDDTMREFEAHIKYSRTDPPTVTIGGQEVHTWSQTLRGNGSICRIQATETLQIPPKSTVMVKCEIDDTTFDKEKTHWVWIEPATDSTQPTDMTIGEALIRTETDDLTGYIPIINTGTETLHIETDDIKVEGTEVLDDTPLGRKVQQLVAENEEWLQWQHTGKTPMGLFPPGVTPLRTPTTSLQDLWHHIRKGITEKIPDTWFYELDWSGADITDEQKEVAKYFLCQERTAVAKSKYDLGITDILEHRIELEPNSSAVRCRKRRVPYSDKKAIDEEITRLLSLGLIRKSFSDYSSPLIIVYKKDLSKRFCVDLRKVNSLTIMDQYPLPHMDTLIESLAGSEFLTSLDLQSGYWQFPLREQDKHKTAFIVDQGLFEWNVIPQGARTSGATFMRGMQSLFSNMQDIAKVYVDDVIVSTIKPTATSKQEWESIPSWVRHLWDLILVLRTVRQARLKFKSKKIIPFKKRTEFLGFIVSGEGLEPSPSKVTTITQAPAPADLKELRSWLGLIGFYRKHIPDFSRTAVPLYALTNKGVSFLWTDECAKAFASLKAKLTEEPIMLVHPDWAKKEYYLYCDASAEGLGVVFAQPDVKYHHRVIAYASRTFKKSERNWPSTERECYAIVWGMRHFWHYVSGCHTTVFTDNTAATYLMNLNKCSQDLTGRLARWALSMQQQRYTLIYKKGDTHLNADALSRHPFVDKIAPDDTKPDTDTTELALEAIQWWSTTSHLSQDKTETLPTDLQLPHYITPLEAITAEFLTMAKQNSMRYRYHHTNQHTRYTNAARTHIRKPITTGERTFFPNQHTASVATIAPTTMTNEPQAETYDTETMHYITELQQLETNIDLEEELTELQTAQRTEEPTQTWINYLTQQQLPDTEKEQVIVITKCKQLHMSNGTLYYQRSTHTDDTTRPRMVIPQSWRCFILKHYHSKGHCGALRTYKTIAEKYYWEHMYADILKYIKHCTECVTGKEGPHRREELIHIPVTHPWQIVATDICGPFKETERNNKYIIVFVDYLTNWPEAMAIPDTKANTVIRAFKELILSRHPAPQILISDLGSCYTSNLMKEVMTTYGIDHRKAAVNHHQTNGKAEKLIHTFTIGLRIMVDEDQTNWDTIILDVLQAYRSTVQTTIGTTPYQMLHGFPMITAEDRITGLENDTHMRNAATTSTLSDIRRNWNETQHKREKEQAAQKKNYDSKKKSQEHTFTIGQTVVIKGPPVPPNMGLSPKLGKPFQGPYTIVKITPPNLEIQYTRGNKIKTKTIHMNDAKVLPKPYLNTPTYDNEEQDGPVEFEDKCIYCAEEFRIHTQTPQTWIECSTCSNWAHITCTLLQDSPPENEMWNCINCDIAMQDADNMSRDRDMEQFT